MKAKLMSRTYAGDVTTLRAVRADVDAWLAEQRAGTELRERLALIVSELAANAVEAAHAPYRVEVSREHSDLLLRVVNPMPVGASPPVPPWALAGIGALRGRGMAIVAALADVVQVRQPDPRTLEVVVRLAFDG